MEIKSILGEKVLIEWRKMKSLQPDNLKLPYNIAHLKKSLLDNNFAMPFFGWQNGSEVYVIDGHQRKEVLMELESEGVKVPELLDCQLIKAKDRKEAVKILLNVYNQKSNPIDLEVLTEWVNIEQVECEVQSLNVVDVQDIEEDENEKDLSSSIKNLYRIEIVCKDEEHQENTYNKLIEQGYECRLLTL